MTTPPLTEIWVYLSATPLLWLALTLLAYLAAFELHRRLHFNPLANPVLIAVVLLVCTLYLTATPYDRYFDGAQFVHFLLGPATVALAVPLYGQLQRLKSMALPIVAALVAGSLTAALSALPDRRRVGREPADDALVGAQVGDHPDRHGNRRKDGWPAFTGGGAGDPHRHSRCGGGLGADESAAGAGRSGNGLCAGPGLARHRYRAGVSDRADRRRLRSPGNGPERPFTAVSLPWLLPLLEGLFVR